jgi:hypothetical protein
MRRKTSICSGPVCSSGNIVAICDRRPEDASFRGKGRACEERASGISVRWCHVYRQPGRLILHLVNLTSAETWRQPVHELIPIGPLQVQLKLPADARRVRARLLVSGKETTAGAIAGGIGFEVKTILDHEVVVISD